ncbi:MAG: hypothetical protein H0X35_10745 [Pseudonocardiales bacterium]|nr:hypothetical protein [Pseudonocardiales bacterium]
MTTDGPHVLSSHDRALRRRGRRRMMLVGAAMTGVTAAAAIVGVANAGPAVLTVSDAMASTSSVEWAPRCGDGPWRVAGASVEGAPAGFDAGDVGRTYIGHDGAGWHLRTTDARPGPHHYSGTITASPGASFADVDKVRLDPGDVLFVDDRRVLHYAFTTFDGIDGVNFRVSACDGDRTHERLTFALQKNGVRDDPGLIDVGANHTHPVADPFVARRSI